MNAPVRLDDPFTATSGPVYVTGSQALVLIMMQQRRRDIAAGLNTGGFCSGYRGSPLSTLDRDFERAMPFLHPLNIRFQGGVNEALGATAVWGTQMSALDAKANVEGVFGMWYGKGAGLDQCIDVMRHANNAGTAAKGGVLAVVGDDHALKSSAQPHHCEPTFADLRIPILYPSDMQEMLTYGLYGYALSRDSACWVGLKVLPEVVNGSGVVQLSDQPQIVFPEELEGAENRHIQWPDPWPSGERRFHALKLPRIHEFVRLNRLNRLVVRAEKPKFAIITAGKSYLDVVEALRHLGLSLDAAAGLGVSLLKIAVPWPLEPDAIRSLARDHGTFLVVEEKRPIVEEQIKSILYGSGEQPLVLGREDRHGQPLLATVGELSPEEIAVAIARTLGAEVGPEARDFAEYAVAQERLLARLKPEVARTPFFCSGCPHTTSTRLPEGSKAMAGIGCHGMSMSLPDRNTTTHTHMGGEGATWIGHAPFTDEPHMFQNLGEGTYHHSGSLAIRAAVSAGVNITYKLLYNDAVAMTGGQAVDGQLTVPQMSRQLHDEGIGRIAIVTDDPKRYAGVSDLAPGATVDHRDDLDRVQRELREIKGVTAIIYDQMCATEKRRRRKRGLIPESSSRVFINDLVCEGCGDCSKKSNCLSVVPVDTEFGRKRRIDQSSCNKDMSCVKGFCPSFVVVEGGRVRSAGQANVTDTLLSRIATLSEPPLPVASANRPYNILLTGIGGTGVVTVAAVIAMAARLSGLGVSVHDRMGMAQKFGAVTSHIRIAPDLGQNAARIPMGAADLVLGGDLMVTAQQDVLRAIGRNRSHVLVNSEEAAPGAFTINPDFDFKSAGLRANILAIADPSAVESFEATRLATILTGDAIGANMFMLGYAYQRGLLPVSLAALEQAIVLNGVAVEATKRTLALGRLAGADLEEMRKAVRPLLPDYEQDPPASDLEAIIEKRRDFLVDYQDEAYSERYLALVRRVRAAEEKIAPGQDALSIAAARYYFKLLAYKDEYEVARLYAHPDFVRKLQSQFEGDYKISFRLAPPLIAKRDPITSEPRKIAFGGWMLHGFRLLSRLRFLRGTRFDPFGYSPDRKLERQLVADYEMMVDQVLNSLRADNYQLGVELLALPEQIRGYGPIKEQHMTRIAAREKRLREAFGASKISQAA